MSTFADRVIKFNRELTFTGSLPKGIHIMNPFQDNVEVLSISESFYHKFYNDNKKRKLILGINPGRLGAGATGIPFTDTKRLSDICGIRVESITTHEPSSVFIYTLIEKYGGAKKFYSDYYINSICPLGFVEINSKGNAVNCNYYDYEELFSSALPFIIPSIKTQISFGIDADTVFILGKKNARYLALINEKEKLFKSIVALDHPRYIEQYKANSREKYLSEYLQKLAP